MKKAWEKGLPVDCGWYDVSYLTQSHGKGKDVKLLIGNGAKPDAYQLGASLLFKINTKAEFVRSGAQVRAAIADASNFGQSPVDLVTLVGHGLLNPETFPARMKFVLDNLRTKVPRGIDVKKEGAFFGFPLWEDAVIGKLSSGFWFSESAQVRLIACN